MLIKNPQPHRSRMSSLIGALSGLVLVAAVLVVALTLGSRLLANPFRTTQIDRSMPPVLLELRDLADFHSAQGQFSVTIDVENDVAWMPSWIAGERVQFAAVGTVDAVVDLRRLTDASFEVNDKARSVVVTLGAVRLDEPVIDLEASHVMNRDRGMLDRLGGVFTDSPTTEASLYALAEDKIATAAAATDLIARAEQNTATTIGAMLEALGYERVEVRFEPATAEPAPSA